MNTLEKLEKKKIFRFVVVTVCIALVIAMLFGILSKRKYIFYDEMMSYYRSAQALSIGDGIDWENPEGIINTIVTGEDFSKDIVVDDESKILGNVSFPKLVKIILTERQYNIFLNFVSGIRQGGFSFLDSIILNMILLAFCLYFMYRISREMFGDWKYGLLAIALAAFAPGVTLVAGYMRFYILYSLCILVLFYAYVRLSKMDESIPKQIPHIILILAATWFGYCNAEYTLIFAAMMCIMYLITCLMALEKKKFWVCFLPHFLGVVGFVGINIKSIIYELQNGDSSGIGMSQLKTAFDNFANRSGQIFKIYLNTFFSDAAFYSLDKFVWILLIVWIVLNIALKKKLADFYEFRSWYILTLSVVFYLLIVSRIAPWDMWRYISPVYFLVIFIFIGLFQLVNFKPMFKSFAALLLIVVAVITYSINIQGVIEEQLDGDGPTVANREYIQENYAGIDSVYFYDGDAGTMFYGAFLWPEDGQVYFTTVTDFRENTVEKTEIMQNDQLLVWIDRSDETLQKRVMFLMDVNGYTTKELVMDTGSEGRHLIYLFER